MCTPETESEHSKGAVRGPKFFEELRDGSPCRTNPCRDHPDRKTGFSAVFVNVDSSPPSSSSSESSTPTGSPTSSVSCDHHFCGSLFVKCAEHGRWPLLQTFTNRDSPLSKQTFSTRGRRRKSDNLHDVICKSDECDEKNLYENLLYVSRKRPPNKAVSRLSSELSLPSENCEKKNFLKKNFEKSFVRNFNGQLITRKHHSLPSNRVVVDGPAKSEFGKIKKSSALPSNGDQLYVSSENSEEAKFESRTKGSSKKILNSCLVNFNEGKEKKNSVEDEGYLNRHTKTSAKKDWRNFSSKSENNYSSSQLRLDSAKGNGEKSDSEMLRKSCSNHFGWSRRQSLDKKLNKEEKEWEHRIDYLETEVLLLQRELKKRDQEKIKLQREVHKLKSVLQETSIFNHEGDLLSSLQDSHGMPGQIQHVVNIPNPNKKQGISGESSDHGRNHDQIEIQRFEKDFRSKQLIKDAIMENDFLKNLDTSQVREIVESVYPKEFCEGDYVLREGEAGSHLYVTAEGELEVVKDHKVLGRMGPGKAFGELAILYNCRRTASIKVVSHAKVWVLDRRVFQQIMMKTGLQRLQENLNFLRSVPLLQSLSNEVLAKIADVLEVDFYPSGEHIIRQGASGDTFFIISSGSVKVTQQKPGRHEEEDIRILNKGDYFGEQALLKEDWRTANVIALSPGVECLTLDRESFIQLIGDLSELQEKDYGDQIRSFSRPSSSSSLCDKEEYDYIRLEDLDVVSTLGVGGFGRVELVQYAKNKNMTFALKCLKKQHIVETKQQEHVYSERNIMMACNSPFICRLYKTFRDSKYVYMLQEVLLGGEVWTILRERGYFDEYTTKFVTGCVLEAFEYLHARGIVYRDLKPENLLLDNTGYAKLVDFGFSKRVGFSSKTWTFCGTPEYLAPEIILNKGHDRAVDYWSLGILMHELLTGIPPFAASDPMRTYNIILKGIDMIDFPKHITRTAINLIKKLCRDAPCERLGYQRGGILDIKKHKWFQGFDWSGLKQRILIPPISPLVRSPTDTSNFDFYSKDTAIPPDEFSNWDAEF